MVIIVYYAGVLVKCCPADWQTIEDYQRTINVNLLGTIDVTSTFLPLIKKEKGRIVTTTSTAGWFAAPFACAYNVSKFGLEAYSDTIRRELNAFGISVHVVEPGGHNTNIMSRAQEMVRSLRSVYDDLPQETQDEYGEEFVHDVSKVEITGQEDITPVVDAYVHAVVGRFPRARYVVGVDAKFLLKPLSYMPESISDWLVLKIMPFSGVLPRSCR